VEAIMINTVCVRLPRDPRCGAIARRALESHSGGRLGQAALEDAKMVTAELVNNAYLHGEGAIELRIEVRGDFVRIEVRDEGKAPSIAMRAAGGDGGMGLRLVDAVASRWGAGAGLGYVWAELSV
jgi:anti-sigma regulatory factor (Ser/Thr protein kinase)